MKKKCRTIELAPQTAEMFARCVAVLKPPPELTLSQWADTYRMLSAENSATPGRWHTDNAPYQRTPSAISTCARSWSCLPHRSARRPC